MLQSTAPEKLGKKDAQKGHMDFLERGNRMCLLGKLGVGGGGNNTDWIENRKINATFS